jgi:hypothetical protein
MTRSKKELSPTYARRIARGLAKGITRSQARGHPAPGEKFISKRRMRAVNWHKLQFVIKEMKAGKSLTKSARAVGLQPDTVRRTLKSAKLLKRRGRRWSIRGDIPTRMLLYTEGEARSIIPADAKNRSAVGKFMRAVRTFLTTNDPKSLAPFVGTFVWDLAQKKHPFETDENTLYQLSQSGAITFEDIYEFIVVG